MTFPESVTDVRTAMSEEGFLSTSLVISGVSLAISLTWTLAACLAFGCGAGTESMLKPLPEDFLLKGASGGLVPGSMNYTLEIDAEGRGRYLRYRPDDLGPPIEESSFMLGKGDVESVWRAVAQARFFTLDSSYSDPFIDDGAYASLRITARGGRTSSRSKTPP